MIATPGTESEGPDIDAIGIVHALLGALRLVQMYPQDHPIVDSKVRELEGLLQQGLSVQAKFCIDVTGGTVHLDGRRVHYERIAAAADLAEFGISSFLFQRGLDSQELWSLLELVDAFRKGQAGDADDPSRAGRLPHVKLGRLVPVDTTWRSQQWESEPSGDLDPDYAQSLRLAQTAFDDVALGGRIDTAAVRDLVDLLVFKVASSSVAISQILAIKQYENLTYCHSVNVAMLSLLLGRQLGVDGDIISMLVEAALLHDIGKTRIPLEVLQKPGGLDKRERELIETHPLLGAEILAATPGLHPLTPTIAIEHHRTIRGGGYPDLGAGIIPHALSQLVSVADVYEAVTGARSYRPPMRPEQACLLLARLAGESLNTALVKAFINAVTFFPIGSFVSTSNHEYGIVVGTTPGDALHPRLALMSEDRTRVVGIVDTSLRDVSGTYVQHVVETLSPTACPLNIRAVLENAMPEAGDAESLPRH